MRRRSSLLIAFGVVCLAAVPGTPAAPRAAIAAAQAGEPRVIEVVAKRFSWEPAEIQVTVGERVRLVLRTADGLHGIDLKKFKISKEIPRGNKPVTVEFTADEAGRFPFLCSEYCGDGHDDMKGVLVVTARDAAPPAAPPEPPAGPPAPQN
ncbi:MAG TPA: cupredoxin domain-containing protein [Vicinamibacterales bacterium]|nr:cupredoxin domain-containing protein [Vicinamibacterales bacterium]